MKGFAAAVLAILIVGCAGLPASPVPAPPSVASSPSPIAAQSGGSETACPAPAWSGTLPVDRLVRVEAGPVPGADVVTFTFGPPVQAGERSNAELSEVSPPFVHGTSGLPLEVDGTSFVWAKFDELLLFDDTGGPAFEAELEFRPELSVVRHVVNSEEFEGVSTWIIGYRGPSCVAVQTDLVDRTLRLLFGHRVP